jgi:hypothetical protein
MVLFDSKTNGIVTPKVKPTKIQAKSQNIEGFEVGTKSNNAANESWFFAAK